jgi:hypothetical protein
MLYPFSTVNLCSYLQDSTLEPRDGILVTSNDNLTISFKCHNYKNDT